MNKIQPLIAIYSILLFLNACSSIAEGLGGSKKKGNDEFLVEKKAPLVLPPSFGKLPEPGIKKDAHTKSVKEGISSIEEIINQRTSIDTSEENNDLNNSIEKLIIDKINEQ